MFLKLKLSLDMVWSLLFDLVSFLYWLTGPPVRFSDFPRDAPSAPPTLGQHTDHVLSNILQLQPKEIERLRVEGVVQWIQLNQWNTNVIIGQRLTTVKWINYSELKLICNDILVIYLMLWPSLWATPCSDHVLYRH